MFKHTESVWRHCHHVVSIRKGREKIILRYLLSYIYSYYIATNSGGFLMVNNTLIFYRTSRKNK